jgi:hypothetical protein
MTDRNDWLPTLIMPRSEAAFGERDGLECSITLPERRVACQARDWGVF